MLRRVALVRTDVSEELSPSSIRVTRICELGTTPPVATDARCVMMMMVAIRSYETYVFTRVTRRNIQKMAFVIVTAVKTSNITYN
jgi:hypothetical protein